MVRVSECCRRLVNGNVQVVCRLLADGNMIVSMRMCVFGDGISKESKRVCGNETRKTLYFIF